MAADDPDTWVCPECGKPLVFIRNLRFDERTELIPGCEDCKKAFRDPELGWKVLDAV